MEDGDVIGPQEAALIVAPNGEVRLVLAAPGVGPMSGRRQMWT